MLRHLEKIKECRNTFTHGNLQDFYKKIYPQHCHLPIVSLNMDNPNRIVKHFSQPIKDSPNEMILMHMFGTKKNIIQPYLKKDFIDVYIQTAHILDFVLEQLDELNEKYEIDFKLKNILPPKK